MTLLIITLIVIALILLLGYVRFLTYLMMICYTIWNFPKNIISKKKLKKVTNTLKNTIKARKKDGLDSYLINHVIVYEHLLKKNDYFELDISFAKVDEDLKESKTQAIHKTYFEKDIQNHTIESFIQELSETVKKENHIIGMRGGFYMYSFRKDLEKAFEMIKERKIKPLND